jgi:Mce-associated membrane protein
MAMKLRKGATLESAPAETDPTAPESTESDDMRPDKPADPEPEGSADAEREEAARPESSDSADTPADDVSYAARSPRERRAISLSVRSLVVAAVIAILAGAVGTLAWLYIGAQDQLTAQASESANDARAEKMSLAYSINAATMDFKDLQAWKVKLVAGTSPELNHKLSDAANSMEQVLVPLEWSSTAQPLVAKVRSRSGGLFVVDCFVSVQTKTVQAPEPLQSTATYSLTIDSNNNWLITDVGGVGSVVGPK